MIGRGFKRMARIGVFTLAGSGAVIAQTPTQVRFTGLINDYTAATLSLAGPWEVRGEWSLALQGSAGKADFSAAITMIRSDLWVSTSGANPDDPAARVPHTHHIGVSGGVVTPITGGFRVTGTATVTGNGNPAPFGLNSPIQIDISGGSSVAYSNIKITFGGGAAGHFGTQPLDGVVSAWN
jgi:hypothetical protein